MRIPTIENQLSAKDFLEDLSLFRTTLVKGTAENQCPSFVTESVSVLDLLELPADVCLLIAMEMIKCLMIDTKLASPSIRKIVNGEFSDVGSLTQFCCYCDMLERLAVLHNNALSMTGPRTADARRNLLDIVIRIIDIRRSERSVYTSRIPSRSFAEYGLPVVEHLGKQVEGWIKARVAQQPRQ